MLKGTVSSYCSHPVLPLLYKSGLLSLSPFCLPSLKDTFQSSHVPHVLYSLTPKANLVHSRVLMTKLVEELEVMEGKAMNFCFFFPQPETRKFYLLAITNHHSCTPLQMCNTLSSFKSVFPRILFEGKLWICD